MSIDIKNLPTECLVNILNYLSATDRKNTACVNKDFHRGTLIARVDSLKEVLKTIDPTDKSKINKIYLSILDTKISLLENYAEINNPIVMNRLRMLRQQLLYNSIQNENSAPKAVDIQQLYSIRM